MTIMNIYPSSFGPFDVKAGVVQRSPGLVDLMVHDRPGTSGYQLWSAGTLNDAYGEMAGAGGNTGVGGAGCTARLLVNAGDVAASPSAIARRVMVEDSRKGQSRFLVDVRDYGSSDDTLQFYRVQERRESTGALLTVPAGSPRNAGLEILGPILIAPPAIFYGNPGPALSLQGTAPGRTLSVAGMNAAADPAGQTPWPMMIWLPTVSLVMQVINLDAGEDLLVSSGLGMPFLTVPAGETMYLEGFSRMLVLAAGGNPSCAFTIQATFHLGGN